MLTDRILITPGLRSGQPHMKGLQMTPKEKVLSRYPGAVRPGFYVFASKELWRAWASGPVAEAPGYLGDSWESAAKRVEEEEREEAEMPQILCGEQSEMFLGHKCGLPKSHANPHLYLRPDMYLSGDGMQVSPGGSPLCDDVKLEPQGESEPVLCKHCGLAIFRNTQRAPWRHHATGDSSCQTIFAAPKEGKPCVGGAHRNAIAEDGWEGDVSAPFPQLVVELPDMDEWEQLRRLAQDAGGEATEWRSPFLPGSAQRCAGVDTGDSYIYLNIDKDGSYHASTVETWKRLATYIAAANPAVVLKLIAQFHAALNESQQTKQKLAIICDQVMFTDSLGVQGSDFVVCRWCGGSSAPGRGSVDHKEDCLFADGVLGQSVSDAWEEVPQLKKELDSAQTELEQEKAESQRLREEIARLKENQR